LTFWRDGFTIEDGLLMRYDEHEEILAAIQVNEGLASPTLLGVAPGQPVDVVVSKRTGEDYVPDAWGARLDVPVPGFSGASSSSSGASSSSTSTSAANKTTTMTTAPTAATVGGAKPPTVDESAPVAQVQVRLVDGGRLLARLNTTHTVADLRAVIDACVLFLCFSPLSLHFYSVLACFLSGAIVPSMFPSIRSIFRRAMSRVSSPLLRRTGKATFLIFRVCLEGTKN
ncbi:hypothetical protein B0H17DRAFT_949679, partial [Mycena rosella]